MSPVKLFFKVAGSAFITAGALVLLSKKFAPSSSDVMTGAIHFKKGFEEFYKGMSTVLFGTSGPSEEDQRKRKETSRIMIE